MLGAVANSQIGCKIANQFINILAYADDLVLIAPSWRALQDLLSVLYSNANEKLVVQSKQNCLHDV